MLFSTTPILSLKAKPIATPIAIPSNAVATVTAVTNNPTLSYPLGGMGPLKGSRMVSSDTHTPPFVSPMSGSKGKSYWGSVKRIRLDQLVGTATTFGARPTNEDLEHHCIINRSDKDKEKEKEGVNVQQQVTSPVYCDVNKDSILYCGLFDGHGGIRAVEFVRDNFHRIISAHNDQDGDLATVLYRAYKDVEGLVQDESITRMFDGGTTSAVVLIKGEELIVANTGDTRILLCTKGRARLLSEMHVASNPKEKLSLELHGGVIKYDAWGTPRVGGVMMVTRVLGPIRRCIPGLTWIPYINTHVLEEDDCFLVLGTDGIFNVMTNQEVVDIVKFSPTPAVAAENIVQKALDYKTDDNATATVVRLQGWGKFQDINYTDLFRKYNFKLFGHKIDFPETLVPLVLQNATKKELLHHFFKMFCPSQVGTISRASFKEGMKSFGYTLSNEDFDLLLASYNSPQNLTFDDFEKIL